MYLQFQKEKLLLLRNDHCRLLQFLKSKLRRKQQNLKFQEVILLKLKNQMKRGQKFKSQIKFSQLQWLRANHQKKKLTDQKHFSLKNSQLKLKTGHEDLTIPTLMFKRKAEIKAYHKDFEHYFQHSWVELRMKMRMKIMMRIQNQKLRK